MRLLGSQLDWWSLSESGEVSVRPITSHWEWWSHSETDWESVIEEVAIDLTKIWPCSVTYYICTKNVVSYMKHALLSGGTNLSFWWFLMVTVVLPLGWVHLTVLNGDDSVGKWYESHFFRYRIQMDFNRFRIRSNRVGKLLLWSDVNVGRIQLETQKNSSE